MAGRTASMAWAVGGLVVGVLITGTASAATGGTFILGRANSASGTTSLVSGSGAALALRPGPGAPPLSVASSAKVPNLNVDKLDNLDSTQLQRRVARSCPDGQAIRAVSAGGAVTCNLGDGFFYVTASSTNGFAQAFCPTGTAATSGGGLTAVSEPTGLAVSTSFFDDATGRDSWVAAAKNFSSGTVSGTVEAEAYCWTGPVAAATSGALRRGGGGSALRRAQDALVRQYLDAAGR